MGRKKKQEDLVREESEADIISGRLRSRANKTVLSSTTSNAELPIPKKLRRGDNADITKRNTSRKKKYLFLFPGALELSPGARIGELRELNTPNPILTIDVPGGHITLRGTLVFPKNAFLTLKPGRGCREMRVTDTLDTIVAFSEWSFVKSGSADAVPSNIPEELVRREETSLWKRPRNAKGRVKPGASENDSESLHVNGVPEAPTRSNPKRGVRISTYAERDHDSVENTDNSDELSTTGAKPIEQTDLIDADEEESSSSFEKTKIPKRCKRPIIELDDESEDEEEDNEADNVVLKKRSGGITQRRKSTALEVSEDDDEVEEPRSNRIATPRSSGRKRRNVNYSQNFSDDDSDEDALDKVDDDEDYQDQVMDSS